MSGFACDMKEILKICRTHKLKLVEDCAHGLGTFLKRNMLETLVFLDVFLFILQNILLLVKVE